MTDHIGQTFGNYQVLRLLGRGNFADVYLGEHRFLDISAAIKLLHVQIAANTHETFLREARTLARLQHPHIIRVLDFGLQDGTPYLIMEYVPNGTLRGLYPRGSCLSLEQIVGLVKQLAPALDYAHEQHVIHRDIKPDNILLNAKNELIISDFGIAVVQQTLDSISLQKHAGTPLYMAPEQIEGRPCAASDQYALGTLVYEWLVGEPPFRGATYYEIFAQHLQKNPPGLRARVPNLPPAVEDAVFGALAKDPRQRFPTVQDFAVALEEACFATMPLPKQISLSTRQGPPPQGIAVVAQSTRFVPAQSPMVQPTDKAAVSQDVQPQPSAQPSHSASIKAASSSRARTNRQRLLRRVRSLWIDGVLEHSLHGAALLALGLHEQPDAIANPWQLALQFPDATSHPLQPETRVTQVYDDANGELLILGAPGSGKTTLLLELARDLLERAEHDEEQPMPVIFNLSSWSMRQQPLADWLVEELNIKYQVPRKLARSLVDDDQVSPLLDGLDEVATKDRTACIEAINTYRQEHGLLPLVVCSRSADYLSQGTRVVLRSAVMIQPLTPHQVETYLRSLGKPMLPLYQAMQTDAELRDLATSPLMLSILTLTYQGTPFKQIAHNGSLSSRQHQVFSAYVERMLQRSSSNKAYTPQQTIHWLTQLAQQMKRHNQSIFYIERMQPTWLTKKHTYTRYPRYIEGIIFGLVGMFAISSCFGLYFMNYALYPTISGISILQQLVLYGLISTVVGGLLFGLLNGFLPTPNAGSKPKRGITHIWKRLQGYISRGTFNGLLCLPDLFILALIQNSMMTTPSSAGLVLLIFGSLFALVDMLIGTRPSEILPAEVFSWSWPRMGQNLLRFLLFGILGTLLVSLLIGLAQGLFNLALGLDATLFSSFPRELDTVQQIMKVTAPFIILLSGLLGGVTRGLASDMLNEHILVKPNEGIYRSARHSMITGLIVGLVGGIGIGLVVWFSYARSDILLRIILLCTVLSAPLIGLVSGLRNGGIACIQHVVLRILLRRSDALPKNYPRFLNHAADHILLRKIGGGYIFVHRLLLEYFASLEPTQASTVAIPNVGQNNLPASTPPLKISRRKIVTGLVATGAIAIGGGFVWWLRTSRPLFTYRGHTSSIDTVAWSPNGKYIASGGYNSGVQVWNAANGRLIYADHSQTVKLVWSPDSKHIASVIGDEVHVWDALNGANRYIYKGHLDHFIRDLAWSPNGRSIASSDERAIQVWNPMNGDLVFTYYGGIIDPKEGAEGILIWSPNSSYIASGGYGRRMEVWNALDGKLISTYHGPNNQGGVTDLAWSPNGKYIAFTQLDDSIRVWSPINGNLIYTYSSHGATILSLAWSPDSKYIAYGDGGTVQALNVLDGSQKFSYWAAIQIYPVAWSPDGKRIASGSAYGLVQIWDASGS